MKIYIHTDIEGIAGWVFYDNPTNHSLAYHRHIQRMQMLLTQEVAAACQAALDCGADDVWVNDAHGPAWSILFENLPRGCQIIQGRPGYFDAWLAQFDQTVDALVCIGQHAMAGTPNAVCPHSLWHINGIHHSETTMAAAMAGSFGVPCVCVSGDDKIAAEVHEKIPGCQTAVVKQGIAAQNARSVMPADACAMIYDKVTAGILGREKIKPYTLPGPYSINISNRDPQQKVFSDDVIGDDFMETVSRALNATPYGNFGCDPIDDGSFRWPPNLD